MIGEFAVDFGADVGAVDGVDPEDLAGITMGARVARATIAVLEVIHGAVITALIVNSCLACFTCLAAGEDLDGDVFGEVMGSACFLSCEVGDMVPADDGLAVDGEEWRGGEGAEVGVTRELAGFPGFLDALPVVLTIIIDFHCVFLGLKLLII